MPTLRMDRLSGPLFLLIVFVLAMAVLSQAKRTKPLACPDGVNCPVKSLSLSPVVRDNTERDRGFPAPTSDELVWLRRVAIPAAADTSVVLDLPPELRTHNWGGGSCVHASNVNLLKHQGQFDMAEWWRKTYSGGEYDSRLVDRLEKAGLRYAFAHGGKDADRNGRDDGEEFMEWCIRTRRGAGIFYKPAHSINLAGMDSQYAYLLDNNATQYPEQQGHYERVPLNEFYRRWHGYGGFAWTLVYDPAPSVPELD